MQQVYAVNVSVNERGRRLRRRAGYAYVYRVYDLASNDLLYVGCSNDPRRRLREHACLTYPRATHRFEVDVPALPELHASNAERIQIQTLNPRDNQRLRTSIVSALAEMNKAAFDRANRAIMSGDYSE